MPRSSGHTLRRPIRLVRAWVPRASVMVLLVIVGACNASNDPGPTIVPIDPSPPAATDPATPGPTEAATAASGGEPCAPADLQTEGSAWNAGAGSRFAEVSVGNQGAAVCTLPSQPVVAILDSAGSVVAESDPAADGAGPLLDAGSVLTFTIQFGNWCDKAVALPARAVFVSGPGGVDIAGLVMPTVDDLPPCNGPGQPPTLSTTEWSPAP